MKSQLFKNDIPKDILFNFLDKYAIDKCNYYLFTTILRQICKCALITYTSKVKYEKSAYGIEYYFYK